MNATQRQPQDWHHKGTSCCSPFGTCMLSWFCPCILHGRTNHGVKNEGNMKGFSRCNLSCASFCCLSLCGLQFILSMISRSNLRAAHHLKGNGCKDCLCSCCCQPCDLAQQDKEVARRREQTQPSQNQPKKEQGMVFPSP